MKSIEVLRRNKQMRQMLAEARKGMLVLTEEGKPVAAIVAINDIDDAEAPDLASDAKFLRILRAPRNPEAKPFRVHSAGGLRSRQRCGRVVEFLPEATPTLLSMAGMEIELTRMLGRKADLRTAEDLSRYFREDVLREAEVQYAA